MFLEIHGAGGESQVSGSLLVRHPLPPDRVPLYRALNYTPAMGPAAAHVVSQEYASLGALMAAFLDPSKRVDGDYTPLNIGFRQHARRAP